MIKTKSIGTKALSVVLSALMVFCMFAVLFTATPVKAEAATAGNYYTKVSVNSGNNTKGWNYGRWRIYGKDVNGTNSSETEIPNSYTEKNVDFNDWSDVWSGSSGYFPTRVTFEYSFGGGMTWREMKGTAYLYVSYDNTNWTEIGSMDLGAKSSAFSAATGTKTITVDSSKYPYASTMTASYANSSVTSPKPGASDVTNTLTYSATDQYGVVMASSLCSVSQSSATGVSTTNGKTGSDTTTIKSTANIAGTTNSKTITATCTWSGSQSKTKTATFTLNDCTLNVVFKNGDNSDMSTQSVTYGCAATAPTTTPTKAYDSTYHYSFSSWDKAYDNITADTTVKPTFTSSAHTYNSVELTAATCTDPGSTKFTCSVCGQNYTSNTVPAAKGHNYSSTARYNNNKTHDYLCANGCGTYGNTTNCTFTSAVTTQPTCTSTGIRTYTCSVCGGQYTETVAALGHNFVTYNYNNDATCLADGTETATCSRCTVTDTRTKSGTKLSDSFTGAVKNNNNGTHSFKCVNGCNQYGGTVDCSFNSGVEYQAPTCTQMGITKYTCIVCSYTKNVTDIGANGHSMETIAAVTPTCTAEGRNAYYHCTVCDKYFKDEAGATETTVEAEVLAKNPDNHTGEHNVVRNQVAASCTQAGYSGDIYWSCCDTLYQAGSTLSKRAHTYPDGWMTISVSTCSTQGIQQEVCSVCGFVNEKKLALNPSNHEDIVIDEAVEASCSVAGKTEGSHCEACGTVIVAQNDIEKLPHSYNAGVVTAPTCTATGYTTYTCTICGDSYTDNVTDMVPHTFTVNVGEVTAATCRANATATYKCANCDETTVAEVPDSQLDHSYTGSAKDNGDGTHSLRCVNGCNEYSTEKLDCTYDSGIQSIAPTCLGMGTTKYTCTACGHSYTEKNIPALGHNFVTYVSNGDATCLADGTKTATCTRCTETDTETDTGSKLAHSYTGEIKDNGDGTHSYKCVNGCNEYGGTVSCTYTSVNTPATCDDDAYTTYTCTACGYKYVSTATGTALGHNYGEWYTNNNGTHSRTCSRDASHIETVNCTYGSATCTDSATCTICGYSSGLPIGHDYVPTVTAPTCLAGGYTTYICSRCTDTYIDDHTSATGHSWGEAVFTWNGFEATAVRTCANDSAHIQTETATVTNAITLDPTCTEKGVRTYTAKATFTNDDSTTSVYTATKTDDVAALDHNFVSYVSNNDATCLADGTKTADCTRCDAKDTVTDIGSKLAHAYTGAAQANDDGTHSYKCVNGCNEFSAEKIACSYDSGVQTVAPTCTVNGTTKYTCSVCSYSYEAQDIPALNHNFETYVSNGDATCLADGTKTADCTRCDATDTKEDVGSKLAHSYTGTAQSNDNGTHSYKCVNGCGDFGGTVSCTYTSTVSVAATCTAMGTTKYTCSTCSYSYEEQNIAALGHKFVTYVSNGDATCLADGTKTADCTRCDATDTKADVGSKLAHSYTGEIRNNDNGTHSFKCVNGCDAFGGTVSCTYTSSVKTAPTCTEKGTTSYTCTACGYSYDAEDINSLGHNYTYSVTTAPTCTANGVGTYACSRCTESYTEEIDALGHNYVDHAAKAPKCETIGWNAYQTCSRCDYTSYVELPATGHTGGEAKQENITGASCTTAGTYDSVVYCVTCNKEISRTQRTGELLPHTEVPVSAIAPTCSTYGYAAGTKCSVCGVTVSGCGRIEKLPHTPVTVAGTPATCTQAGNSDETACSVCKQVISAGTVIPASGHKYGEYQVIREATFNTDGLRGYVCETCGEEKGEIVSMWTVYPRIIRFYSMNGLKINIVDDTPDDTSDDVKITGVYKELKHPVAYDLRFTVTPTTGFAFESFYVYLDGELLIPDENGIYTVHGATLTPNDKGGFDLSAGATDTQTVSISGTVAVDEDDAIQPDINSGNNTTRISFWEWLMRLFRRIAEIFKGGR